MSRLLAKRWAIALVASLALNLFLGGMLTARWLMHPPRFHHDMRSMPLKGMRRHLDPSVHEILDRIDAKHSEQIRSRWREAGQARRRAMEELSAEDFDEAKTREALKDFRAKSDAVRAATHEALIELAAALPPEQRHRLSKAWGKRGGKPGGKRGGRRGPWDGGFDGSPPDGGD